MKEMSFSRSLAWITAFSISMGFMESAVVVYLREIYYPEGFKFPLAPISPHIAITEILREAATIIMLLGIGIITGKTRAKKFAWFIYCFGIWDIFYYVFLKLILNWPESLATWDILFLIPVPWVGPVWAPCIVSLTLITLGLIILRAPQQDGLQKGEKTIFISGASVIIASFLLDYVIQLTGNAGNSWTPGKHMFLELKNYTPESYAWPMFLLGEIMIIASIILYYLRIRRGTARSRE